MGENSCYVLARDVSLPEADDTRHLAFNGTGYNRECAQICRALPLARV